MVGSLIVGMVATLLGAICIATAVAIAVLEALRPPPVGAFPTPTQIVSIGKVLVDLIKAFGKLRPVGQLLVVGLGLFGTGIWLLSVRPF